MKASELRIGNYIKLMFKQKIGCINLVLKI